MKLDDYMKAKGFKPPNLVSAMNTKFGTTFSKTSIYRIIEGHHPSLELAVAIDHFTNGKVKPIDLLTNSVLVNSPKEEVEEDFSDLFDEL